MHMKKCSECCVLLREDIVGLIVGQNLPSCSSQGVWCA